MNTKLIFASVILSLGIWQTACKPSGDNQSASSGKASPAATTSKTSTPAATHQGDVDQAVVITANDQMKFNLETFEVAPGSLVQLTLKNVGSMPKFSMGHNVVILDRGNDPTKFVEAAMNSAATDYIPADKKSALIAHTKLLGGGEEDTIVFVAPKAVGDYPFICSFPGHLQVGMKGIMKVR